jgi:hypothetical protein
MGGLVSMTSKGCESDCTEMAPMTMTVNGTTATMTSNCCKTDNCNNSNTVRQSQLLVGVLMVVSGFLTL